MKLFIQSVVLAIVVISMVVTVKYALHSSTDIKTKEIIYLKRVKGCNILQSECRFIVDKKQLGLSLLGNVRTMQPFKLVAEAQNFNSDINSIYVVFSMKSMEMGFNKFKFTKTKISNSSDNAKPDVEQWQASILLPACVNKRSDWKMLVRVETATRIFEVDIPVQIN